jgi:hypothetical protein
MDRARRRCRTIRFCGFEVHDHTSRRDSQIGDVPGHTFRRCRCMARDRATHDASNVVRIAYLK